MTQLLVLAINIIKIEDQDLPWSGGGVELALCLKHLFGCAVYQCASRRIYRIETISLKRGFGPAAVGTSSASSYGRRGLGGRRRFLSLSAAGQRRWFKSEDAAEHLHSPLRRDFGETAEDGCTAARTDC